MKEKPLTWAFGAAGSCLSLSRMFPVETLPHQILIYLAWSYFLLGIFFTILYAFEKRRDEDIKHAANLLHGSDSKEVKDKIGPFEKKWDARLYRKRHLNNLLEWHRNLS